MHWILVFSLWYLSDSTTVTRQRMADLKSCQAAGVETVRFAKEWEGAGVRPSFKCIRR